MAGAADGEEARPSHLAGEKTDPVEWDRGRGATDEQDIDLQCFAFRHNDQYTAPPPGVEWRCGDGNLGLKFLQGGGRKRIRASPW